LGRKKDKNTKKKDEKEESSNEIDIEEDKNLFQDIFGVSIDEIEEEDESEEKKYEDILEDIDEISLDIEEKENLIPKESISQEPTVEKAIEILSNTSTTPMINEIKIPPPIQIETPKPIPPKISKPTIQTPIKKVNEFIPKQPQINISAPPKVKRIQEKQINEKIPQKVVYPEEIPASKGLSSISQAPGIMKTISFDTVEKKEEVIKPITVVEPKPAFKTANLFIEEQNFEHQDKNKNDLSDIRCANCGKRISKKAEESLKAGWIINCDDCGAQIISH